MSPDPITAVGNALAGAFSVLTPVVEEHYAQLYEKEYRKRLGDFDDAMAIDDNGIRAPRIANFSRELCSDAGNPVGYLSGQSIEVPVEYYQALVRIAAHSIRSDELLARLTFKTKS